MNFIVAQLSGDTLDFSKLLVELLFDRCRNAGIGQQGLDMLVRIDQVLLRILLFAFQLVET